MLAPDRDAHHIPVRHSPASGLCTHYVRLVAATQHRRGSAACVPALTLLLCWQGYTGFLPGGQHQMAKTYGNVSKATLAERQANDDPLKWRKFVSYAEFTPPKTPAEGHFIPGYSGNVAGVYSENLFAKTYGKTTLQAVSGDYPKGQIYTTEEQVSWRLCVCVSRQHTLRRGHRSCARRHFPTPHRTLTWPIAPLLSSPAHPLPWAPPSATHRCR